MSTIQRAYKTELALNNEQITACKRHAGAARWAYNWGLARKQESYHATGKSPTAIDLHRELKALKPSGVPWLYQVSKCAPQEALRNLDTAFAHSFRRCQRKQRGLSNFRLTGSIVVFADAIQLPRLGRLRLGRLRLGRLRLGRPRLKERTYLPTTAKILSATVSERGGHGYVSVLVEQEQTVLANSGPVVGVDLGVKTLATLSDGTTEPNPRHLRTCLGKLKRLQRTISRKQKGGCNRKKAVRRLATLHRRIANQRANTLHQFTSRLAKTKSVVVIEDLNVAGMLKNHHLAQAIGDVGFGEFRRQLTYKAAWYGCRVLVASRWEPSSKTCSDCGWMYEDLSLADRVFRCEDCGLVIDRDLNAARNLAKLAGSSSESRTTCGEESAGQGLAALVKLSPLKQEPDAFDASV
jgi:putative transposase